MKHLILIIILAMHGLCLNGKDISIEFSVEMEDKDAYLIITYHNNGTTDYYLPSLFYNDTQYAEFFPRYCNSFKPYRSSRTENIERLGEFRGAEYNLTFRFIDRNIRTELNLEPLRDSCIDYLNAEVAAYYDFMGVNNKKVFEILRNEDYVKHSPFFVFVKSNRRAVQKINISAIVIAGIILHIRLENYTPPSVIEHKFRDPHPYPLPLKIDPYSLYTEAVECDPLTVDFSTCHLTSTTLPDP